MNKDEIFEELKKRKDIPAVYMMGTTAYHQMGDISRDEEDLFCTKAETSDFYIGMWVYGFGFFDVLFPKATSRKLTSDELENYNNSYAQINSQPPFKLHVNTLED